MVDPKRVVTYEDMLKVIQKPEKVIIDVRNPEEIDSTGKIPSSINIPCTKFLTMLCHKLYFYLSFINTLVISFTGNNKQDISDKAYD